LAVFLSGLPLTSVFLLCFLPPPDFSFSFFSFLASSGLAGRVHGPSNTLKFRGPACGAHPRALRFHVPCLPCGCVRYSPRPRATCSKTTDPLVLASGGLYRPPPWLSIYGTLLCCALSLSPNTHSRLICIGGRAATRGFRAAPCAAGDFCGLLDSVP
jgi:hypothetical protein